MQQLIFKLESDFFLELKSIHVIFVLIIYSNGHEWICNYLGCLVMNRVCRDNFYFWHPVEEDGVTHGVQYYDK